ncbi:MAG: sulfatase-like hydrolase/transferase [Desulfobacterales bacterium]|nr:sulfatase-like hydrolase/transferase [Desulfobacterales bacterium]
MAFIFKTLRDRLATFKPAIKPYIAFLLFLSAYTLVAGYFGGLPIFVQAWRLEIPLLLYLFYYFNLITRPSRWQAVIAALPIVLAYVVFDAYHVLFGRMLRLTEVTELPEMFMVMPILNKILLLLAVGLPLAVFLRAVQWRQLRPLLQGAVPLLVLVVAVEGFPAFFMAGFERVQRPIHYMSDTEQAELNGRIGMALYNEARRINSLEKTIAYRGNIRYLNAFDDVVAAVNDLKLKNNVHLIVLESFLDPNLLRNARFSRNPEHPAFEALFKNKAGMSISPVFGGSTAQAEFEVLCGVPAMRELSGIEFDVFTGAKTLCLSNILGQAGYHTMATNAFYPDFFNATKAYEGLGFESIYYPREYAPVGGSYFNAGDVTDEFFMYDGDLFSQNLAFVGDWMRQNPGKPLLNYIMTVYGHTPHLINLEKRPKVVEISGMGKFPDDQLERAVNQYYYRTEVIASYVKELVRIDPRSIIILVSDHLPSLTYGPNTYADLRYLDNAKDAIHLNRIYIVENGRPVRYDTIHHYDVPRIILSYLTQNKVKHTLAVNAENHADPTHQREQYMTVMAHAMDGKPIFSLFGYRNAHAD